VVTDDRSLNDILEDTPEPTLEHFLEWARSVGAYAIADGFERYTAYLQKRKEQ
jgi:hypothetical protein